MYSSLLRVQWKTDRVLLVSILIVIIGCTGTEGAEWGEVCDSGANVCNAAKFLQCDPEENVCRCQGRPESRYDEYDKSCHKLDNTTCSGGGTISCPLNGFCNFGAVPYKCVCIPVTPVTIRKDCAAAYGATCTNTGTCDHNAYVQCIDDDGTMTCKCDDTISVYDSEGQQCLLKASQPCTQGTIDRPAQSCITGSECTVDGAVSKCRCGAGLSENQEHLCRVNFGGTCTDALKCDEAAFLICDADKCICKPDLYDDGNGVCVTSFDKSCAAGEKCDSSLFLDCIDDKCKCRGDLIDAGLGDCKSLSGGQCNKPGKPDCDVGNYLSCGSDNICHCKDGLTENADGVCRAAVNKPCATDLPCDEKNFLHCSNEGTCVCNEGLADMAGTCTASLGGSCAGGEPCDTSKFLKCDEGATKKCVCRDGTVNNGQVCDSLFDQPCGTGQPNCDATSFLECSNNMCKCLADLVDQGNGDCRSQFGGSCANDQPACADKQFLVCNSDEQCACKPGLEADANNVCLAGLDVSCADGETCDSSKFLVCNQNSKKCACKDDFSNVGGSCRANFGTPCDTTIPCDDSKWLDCNAAANTCQCRSGTIDFNGDGNCQSLINEPCGSAEPVCYEANYLTCVSGSCKCKAEMVESGGECKSILGSSCDLNSGRPTCDETNHLVCRDDDKICHCEDPLEGNPNGRCVLGFGEDCSNSLPCDDTVFLECNSIDNKCLCKSGTVDLGGGTCKSVFGESCGTANQPDCNSNDFLACDGTTCICQSGLIEHGTVCYGKLNADCGVDKPECDAENSLECPEGGSKCQCKAELIDNDEGLCRVIFGGECTIDGSEGKRCDESKFVVCKEDLSGAPVCSCDSDSWFHNSQQVCSIKAGFSCPLVPGEGLQTCGENSHCAGTSDADAVCKCDGDLLPSVEGKCSLSAGQTCNPFQDKCDTAEWQFCDSGTFKCRCVEKEEVVEESSGRCRIRAEYPCEPNPTTMPCTTNAVCRRVSNHDFCVCDHGLLPNSVGKCTLTYGQDCGPPAPGSCDYEGFQTCFGGECVCIDIDNMFYDHHPEGKKCVLMVGKTCKVGSVVPCARHASCVGDTCACDTGYTPDGDGGCKSSGTLYSFWSQLPTYSNLFRSSSYKFKFFQK